MSDISKEQVIDWLSGQSVIEIADLVKELEEKWGVSAAAPAAIAVAAPAGGDGEELLLKKRLNSMLSLPKWEVIKLQSSKKSEQSPDLA